MKRVKQCKTCPWRVGSQNADIPNYDPGLHASLVSTIAEPGALDWGPIRQMACHHSKSGAETPCAGWLYQQLGPGNNIALRLRVRSGAAPVPEVDGEQHQCFEDTLGDE